MAIDSIFSPVTRVRYAVEAARVLATAPPTTTAWFSKSGLTAASRPTTALTQGRPRSSRGITSTCLCGYDKNAVEFEEAADKQDDEKANGSKKLLNMSVNEIPSCPSAPRTA